MDGLAAPEQQEGGDPREAEGDAVRAAVPRKGRPGVRVLRCFQQGVSAAVVGGAQGADRRRMPKDRLICGTLQRQFPLS